MGNSWVVVGHSLPRASAEPLASHACGPVLTGLEAAGPWEALGALCRAH